MMAGSNKKPSMFSTIYSRPVYFGMTVNIFGFYSEVYVSKTLCALIIAIC